MKRLSKRTRNLVFSVVLLLIIAVGVVVAVQTRKRIEESAFSYEDLFTMKVRYDEFTLISEYEQPSFDPTAPRYITAGNFNLLKEKITLDDVYDYADLIVKVKATNDRAFSFQSILTKVVVLEVYKGDQSLKSDEIYVFEWAEIGLLNEVLSREGYNIMNAEDAYYLFLSRRPMPDGYLYTEKDEKTYLLANVYLGKYNETVCPDIELLPSLESLIEWDDFPKYQEVRGWDILPTSMEHMDFYLSNREKALELLGVGIR